MRVLSIDASLQNTGTGRGGRARDRTHASSRPGSGPARGADGNPNMNLQENGRGGALRRPDAAARRPYLEARWFGRMAFPNALAMQEELVTKKRADRSLGDELLSLEHDPVYTIGRTPDQSSLRGAGHLPHPLFPINRGGQATYRGPGQLIRYPIIDLRNCGQDLHRYLRWVEDLLVETLSAVGIVATTRTGLTGVWVENRKVASIGVG